jgi:hypothetical protein
MTDQAHGTTALRDSYKHVTTVRREGIVNVMTRGAFEAVIEQHHLSNGAGFQLTTRAYRSLNRRRVMQ